MINNLPQVSIVIPVFNMGKYVQRCLQSISTQTYTNLEVIIVDDGSTDNSKGQIETVHLNNFMYVYQDNQGVSSARNRGIDLAKGDYVIFIDPDDFIDSNFVKYLVNDIMINDSQLSICGHIKVYSDDTTIASRAETSTIIYDNFIEEFFDRNSLLSKLTCDKMFSLKIIKEHSLYFPVDVPSGQDQVFILSYIMKIKKITTIDEKLYYYYQSFNSKSRSYQYNTFLGTLKKLNYFYEILENEDLFVGNKVYFFKRIYMNLFSQGYLAYKFDNTSSFKSIYRMMRVEMKEYIKKYNRNIIFDVLNVRTPFLEKIVIIINYYFPILFVRYIYKIYSGGN
ncbi:MAG: glycosyltransferase [Acholeplasma sp.]|nr:glycosyltransferase [Acholeplasma sp.]